MNTYTFPHMRGVADHVVAGKATGAQRRLASVHAAAKSEDRRTKDAYKNAVRLLQRLGVEIEQVSASGSTAEIDRLMAEHKWTPTQRFALKGALAAVGAIE